MIKKYLKLMSVLFFILALMISTCYVDNGTATAETQVIIGHAAYGESGSKNQTAGDQSGNEVYTTAWTYSKNDGARHWMLVARPNSDSVAKKIAQVVRDACENNCVGYDQADPNIRSFYYALQGSGWDASKIAVNCETTCTPLIAAAINAAGISIKPSSQGIVSANGFKTEFKTGSLSKYFTVYTSKSYTATSENLKAGDVLITYKKTGVSTHQHGAVVISSPNSPGTNATSRTVFRAKNNSSFGYETGKEYQLTKDLTVKYGPGSSYTALKRAQLTSDGKKNATDSDTATLKKGTIVTCVATNGNWVQVPSGWIAGGSNGKTYLKTVAELDPATEEVKQETKTTTLKLKVGKSYKLAKALYVRKGPGTNYAVKKRSQLTKDAKKHAYNQTKAKLKKGTVVTCIKLKGKWMKIPSGWVYAKEGNIKKK